MSVKAFELVPAVERLKLLGDKTKTSIECIECSGKNLYIGTSDCFVIHYLMEEVTQSNGKVTYISEKQNHKHLALRKPIRQLKAASALARILVLCDNVLSLLNMFNLEPILSGAKAKGITSFTVNDNPRHGDAFSIEIATCAKKRAVQVYVVTEDKITFIKEVAIPELPMNLAVDGFCMCVAMETQYILVNYETGAVRDLYPVSSQERAPFVRRIGKEFVLPGPGIGVFVTPAAISERPPIKWAEDVHGVGFSYPYIVAMDSEFLTIHSILDQKQKQTIPFQNGSIIGDFEGKIFVASSKDVYGLIPLPVEKQMFMHIQQQGGFIKFGEHQLIEAKEMFKGGKLDVRELICLFPNLLPSSSDFTRAVPFLHDYADINQIVQGNPERLQECRAFLLDYLEEIRGSESSAGSRMEIDTALLKLYASSNPKKLNEFLASENYCSLSDSLETLNAHKCYHAQGILYRIHGDYEKALNIWMRIQDEELKDPSFPGLEYIIQFLAKLSDHELVWRHVEWCLQKDPELTVKIFTERPEDEPPTERMRPDTIIDYLHAYPTAVIRYLEHLVFQRKLEKESYHTHLAVLYLNEVLKLRENQSTQGHVLNLARTKLRHMLQQSNLYRVQVILSKVKETDMYAECAILYGKLEEHDKALRIIVHKLQDYGAAENYCDINSSGRDLTYRRRLYQILLGVYLDPMEGKKDSLLAPAISLLNSETADFDTVRVLQLIPENWSIGLVKQFLRHSVENNMHLARTRKIQNSLSRNENLQVKYQMMKQRREPVYLSEERLCQVCNRNFVEPKFVRYPNGVITHTYCARNKTICPVTGKLFSVTKET
ncbi:Transforming growth factor-beta receptor-associated protein 1 [Holothuria leucospilota]|uniref:Transforming growth factor-beta receptor-associated protein 1 n=1 Tax=Holothuria leucospilota TaxID=206669 RepID=A0A9Q1CNF7_HOLLE|nr:Transforming growth factor-beta receptor-associated protein 1 [Holothuria leucospilota]